MKATYPVVTIEEFKKIIMVNLLYDTESSSKEELFKTLLDEGFPKFDKDKLDIFMKGLTNRFIDTVLVDFGDDTFYWCVSCSDAMLVKRPSKKA